MKIARLIAVRLVLGLGTLLVISTLLFFGVELLPGDMAEIILGQDAAPDTVANLRRELGLDQPPHIRYLNWLTGLVQGDLGVSAATGTPIANLIAPRLWNTLFLAGFAASLSIPVAIVGGILLAMYRDTAADKITGVGMLILLSVPEFLLCYVLILWLSVNLNLFPSLANFGSDPSISQRIYLSFLPAVALSLVVTSYMIRMTRAAIINVIRSPYIQMAQLKGSSRWSVVVRHALPNAVAPIATVVAICLAHLVVGVVVVEVIFVYPGIGQLLVDSVTRRDVMVVQACSLVFASAYVLLNLGADVTSILANPRLLHPR